MAVFKMLNLHDYIIKPRVESYMNLEGSTNQIITPKLLQVCARSIDSLTPVGLFLKYGYWCYLVPVVVGCAVFTSDTGAS